MSNKKIKTKFEAVNEFIVDTGLDKIDNNVLQYTVNEKDRSETDAEYVMEYIVKPIISNSKEKILYFTLKTPKEVLKNRITIDNVEIIDNQKINIKEIRSKCEETAKIGLSVVIIDYIQQIYPLTYDKIKKEKEIVENFISIAHDLNVLVVSLFHFYEIFDKRDFSNLGVKENCIKIEYRKGFYLFALNAIDDNVLKLMFTTSKKVIASE